jgi:hypothetical protein
VLYTDSTHLKANANKNRYDTAVIAKSRADYWDALDAAIEQDRTEHGKKPLPDKERQPVEKETKVSRTDPDAGYMGAKASRRASFISIIVLLMAGSASSPIPTRHPPTCMIRSSISAGSIASDSALTSMLARSGWMPAMPPRGSPRGWSNAGSLALPAIAGQLRRVPP